MLRRLDPELASSPRLSVNHLGALIQAAPGGGSRARAPIHPSLLERVNDLNQDLGRILDNGSTGRSNSQRRLTRIAGYLQRQMNSGSGDLEHSPNTA